MPELPEVETVCRGLREKILQKEILSIEIFKPKIIKSEVKELTNFLINKKIEEISRCGKLIILKIAEKFLLIHLKMTGQLIYCLDNFCLAGGHSLGNIMNDKLKKNNFKNNYTVFEAVFIDGSKLWFNDLRQFGLVKLVNSSELEKIKNKFGIEPLTANFTWENFRKIFTKNSRRKLKTLLLDQTKIAGLGNIYADEVAFFAGVLPERKVGEISEMEQKKLFIGCCKILAEAIFHKGTTFRDFLDSEGKVGNFSDFLKVYGRENRQCLFCLNKIKKIKLSGRGTHFCPVCQK